MAVTIEVEEIEPTQYSVTVVEGGSHSTHTVTVEDAYARALTGGAMPTAELVRRSFEFLLEREPKELILAAFPLPVIGRYFPEYEREIRARVRASLA